MRRNLLILSLATLFLIGCAGVSLKSDTTQIAADVSASTIGYLVGQNNPEKISEWNTWLNKLLSLESGDAVISYEKLLAKGFDFVIDEPFLEMQLNKLIRLLEFPELQPPPLPFLKAEYIEMVKIVLGGFKDGLQAALAEAE